MFRYYVIWQRNNGMDDNGIIPSLISSAMIFHIKICMWNFTISIKTIIIPFGWIGYWGCCVWLVCKFIFICVVVGAGWARRSKWTQNKIKKEIIFILSRGTLIQPTIHPPPTAQTNPSQPNPTHQPTEHKACNKMNKILMNFFSSFSVRYFLFPLFPTFLLSLPSANIVVIHKNDWNE